ncbi:MAG: hypothetical protein H7195_10830 [Chryseobacterium sp.]|nr:hypothetical protein [Chryseobacterium sp.]
MSCILLIEGENFNVTEFLRVAKMDPYEKHLKGEKRPFKRTGVPDIYESSGCRFTLSEADFDNFELQKIETINYLKNNFEKLKEIYTFGLTETEIPSIAFGIENKMGEFWCQSELLQLELLKLSSELNFEIEISLYHSTLDDEEEEEDKEEEDKNKGENKI